VSQEDGTVAQSTVTGTSGYMSPEQARGEPLDARSDIYSFGRVLSELAGEGLPSRVAPVIAKALASEPAERWQSAAELRTALEKIPRQASRKRWRLALLAAAFFLTCAVVVFVRIRPGHRPAEMNPVVLVSTGGVIRDPSFSPDGTRVAYSYQTAPGAASDASGIYVKQILGGPPVRLTRNAGDGLPAWSPDDRYIALARDENQDSSERTILLVPAIGGPERRIARADVSDFSWTPDAKWLILSSRGSPNEPFGITLLSVETGERRRLVAPPAAPVLGNTVQGDFWGRLSPDGGVLAFVRSGGSCLYYIYTLRVTRDYKAVGRVQLLVSQPYPRVNGIAWASNRDVVYSVGAGLFSTSRLWRMRATGGSPELFGWAPAGSNWPAVAPAQHLLGYVGISASFKLWQLDLRTGERRVIADSRYFQDLVQYSPDGRRVTFQSDRSGSYEVWTCDADGTNCQQLTFFGGPQGGAPRWSPDGRWIAFDSRVEGKAQIYVIPSDGGKPRRVTGGDSQNMVPSWSRDGKWIYFDSDRSGEWRIWRVSAEGGSAVQMTHNSGGAAVESVDGRYLYFTTIEDGGGPLFRMRVSGGPEVQVAPKVVFWAGFSINSKGVYFLSDSNTLQLLSAETGKITRVVAGTYAFGGRITVSPDDAHIVFSERESSGSDLMLVENFR
jgi:eukaryotic-like serine/threonine-protein kinase